MLDEATQGDHPAYQQVSHPLPPLNWWRAGYPALWQGGDVWALKDVRQAGRAGAFLQAWLRRDEAALAARV